MEDFTTWIDGLCATGMFSVLVAGAELLLLPARRDEDRVLLGDGGAEVLVEIVPVNDPGAFLCPRQRARGGFLEPLVAGVHEHGRIERGDVSEGIGVRLVDSNA